jgi:subfamily B ATP-binding cassette protein HlyB/CyaB
LSDKDLVEFLASVELFSVFEKQDLEPLAAQAEVQSYSFGDAIVNQGEASKGLYVIRSGTVRLFAEEQGKQITMAIRKAGEVFAEVTALREYQHECSARASAKTTILLIPREAMFRVLERNESAKSFLSKYATINMAGGFVTKLFDLRQKLERKELEELIRSIGIKRAEAGQVILEQGSAEDRRLYVVRSGEVNIVCREDGEEFQVAKVGQGDSFGEKACLMRQPQAASAIAATDVVLLVIPDKTLQFILEHNAKLKDLLEERIHFVEREFLRHKKLAERRRRHPLLDLRSKPGMGERVIKRFPLVEQAEEMDCGAACLAMICEHYNISMTLGKLRELANVTTEGATLDSLARVGESLGFTTRGVKATYASIQGFELPFIAHWEGYHYIIVYGVSKHHVWVADPGLGFRKLTATEFEKGWGGTCLLFMPSEDLVQITVQRSPWLRFIGYLKPYRNILSHLVMATLVIDVLGVAPPIIIQNILDRVVVHADVALLNLLIVGLILAQAFTQLTTLLRAFLVNFMVRSLDFTMIAQFFKHTLSLPISFFAKRKTGEIFARFQENITVRNFLTESTISTVLNLVMVFIYLIVLFLYNVNLTLLLLALVIPMGILAVVATPMIKNYARRDFEASTGAESLLMETLSGVETVKATAIERPMRLKWERQYTKALDIRYRARTFNALVGLISRMLNAVTIVVILWAGAKMVLSQELTIGQLMAFNMLMGSVMSPILGLIGLWNEVHGVGVAMERLGDVLDIEPEQKPEDLTSRIVLPDLQGDIRFENVSFRYGGEETPKTLEDISFGIKAGEVVAIVGQSGSGKSTLAKLLVGFYPPTEGKIYVDGYELNLIDKEYYRSQIGYVMQNNLLFSGTISENIALGDSNPDRRQIVKAAKMADAHGFISNLPLRYEQVVGERGVGLSGGQMQRLCIARALYRDPRLLILDEATSSLDAESESNILRNMEEVFRGRTAVVIAHRLSTVMSANKILVLYSGGIAEQGTHEELLEKKGMYHQLVQKQIAGMR